jgi:hypothetical protein
MALFIFANNAATTIAGPISPAAVSVNVAAGTGAEFPNPGVNQQFAATLNDAATGLLTEIVYCTARTGDNFTTIVRAQEGTTALNWLAGDLIANMLTAGQMAAIVQIVTVAPIRLVTVSGNFTMTTADANGSIGLYRTSSPSASNTTLPASSPGQTYTIEDLGANASAFPITINAPGGQSIAGLAAYVINTNRGTATFTYYGSNIWGVDA